MKELTPEEIQKIVHLPHTVVPIEDVEEALEDIDGWLQRIGPWGLNATGVRLKDFEVGAYLPTPAATPFPFISTGPLLVFVKGDKALSGVQAFFRNSRRSKHFSTANGLVDLATE